MQNILGIYIEENLIKYAKVSKNREDFKIEAFGIRFFEDLSSEIKKIIEETYSYNTPISVNLENEQYLYFDIFALLSKKDIEKTIQTEFETYCDEKKYNKNAFETRYAIALKDDEREKFRAIDIAINKIELNRQLQQLDGYRVQSIMPVSVAIGNIAKLTKKQNQIIVNMEQETTITMIIDNQIYEIEKIENGSKEVLDRINQVENSYAKAYEICKNTTIYTAEVEDTAEEQPYLQDIMPTVYEIVQKVQEIVEKGPAKFQTVYLTGTLSCVNNIDLYFQEYLPDVECKILKPNFMDDANTKINIKDYIEVNSAIALAVTGLGKSQELNFKKASTSDKLSKMLKIETPNGKGSKGGHSINMSFKGTLSSSEIWLVRSIVAFILIMIIYSTFSAVLSRQMLNKEDEISGYITEQNSQIAAVNSNSTSLQSKDEKYKLLISDLKRMSEKISDAAASRNSIPNLLNQIMFVIPDKVQLTSIQNTEDKTIVIKAQSSDYQQLGMFISAIKTKSILNNVQSSSGVKSGETITVTIEGELP